MRSIRYGAIHGSKRGRGFFYSQRYSAVTPYPATMYMDLERVGTTLAATVVMWKDVQRNEAEGY